MPVYLSPVTRREFLKSSLAASALLAAGASTAPSESWALLSDIHIAADPNLIHGNVNMTRNLRTVAEEIVHWPDPLSGGLINGDLAFNDGEAADYEAVLRLLRPLREHGLPLHLAVGNHDQREHFWAGLPKDKSVDRTLPDRQTSMVRGAYANWFVLDSLIKTGETAGHLGAAQRAWLAQALDANTDKPALIAIHHHPALGGIPDVGADLAAFLSPLNAALRAGALQDAKELFEILRPRRHVKAYFYGHTHHWKVTHDESGLCLINLPPVAYVFEQGRPNGWVHATLHPEGALLELRCLDHSHKEHGQLVNLAWRA